MKILLRIVVTSLFLLFVTGCMVAPVMPPQGGIYTDYKAPLDYQPQGSYSASKTGTSDVSSILGLFSWGDASIKAAVQKGQIRTIHGTDYRYLNVLMIFHKYTTIVYGE